MTRARRRGWWWLVFAAALLALGAWLMLGAEPPPRPPPPYVSLPRKMTPVEATRVVERRTWTPSAVDAGAVAAPPPARPRDPLLSLMPEKVERGAVVAEVNAILNSELGGLFFDCVTAGGRGDLDVMRDAGFDPKVHLDRMAVIDDSVVMTGQLGAMPFPPGTVTKAYGPRAKLLELPGEEKRSAGVWNDQLVVFGGDEATTRALLDRLERGESSSRPVLDDSQAYGEVYGVIGPTALADLFGDDDPKVRDLLVSATKGLALHVDVSHDVGVVADVQANDATKTDELRKSIGGLLSIARLRAQNRGRDDQAELLDLARVRAGDGAGFRVEAGVPHELVKSMLQSCVDRQQQRAIKRAARAKEPRPVGE
ncbi:MAG: hypothetical protein Q8S33_11600 [Myxococcales bacterium]|nr:hypothetical protein [Myxococcales bacterium]MDP3500975.1 hypothetical protein [Myxococcales bacterium]